MLLGYGFVFGAVSTSVCQAYPGDEIQALHLVVVFGVTAFFVTKVLVEKLQAVARQCQSPGHAPRLGDAGGEVQQPLARVHPVLGRAAGRLRALPHPHPHQGQGRARRGLRQAQRHHRTALRLVGYPGGAHSLVDGEVADTRVHGTTGEAPIARFEREERQALRPLNGRPPFR